MDKQLFAFSDLQIWRRGDRFFARYPVDNHYSIHKENEISAETAYEVMHDDHAALDMLFSLQQHLITAAAQAATATV